MNKLTKVRKLIGSAALTAALALGTSAIVAEVSYEVLPKKVHRAPVEVIKPVKGAELFVVQSDYGDGYLHAVSLSEDTQAPHGYVLDDKYDLGDVVQVTYDDDDILAEHELTGQTLGYVKEEYAEEINAIFEEGYAIAEEE